MALPTAKSRRFLANWLRAQNPKNERIKRRSVDSDSIDCASYGNNAMMIFRVQRYCHDTKKSCAVQSVWFF